MTKDQPLRLVLVLTGIDNICCKSIITPKVKTINAMIVAAILSIPNTFNKSAFCRIYQH